MIYFVSDISLIIFLRFSLVTCTRYHHLYSFAVVNQYFSWRLIFKTYCSIPLFWASMFTSIFLPPKDDHMVLEIYVHPPTSIFFTQYYFIHLFNLVLTVIVLFASSWYPCPVSSPRLFSPFEILQFY